MSDVTLLAELDDLRERHRRVCAAFAIYKREHGETVTLVECKCGEQALDGLLAESTRADRTGTWWRHTAETCGPVSSPSVDPQRIADGRLAEQYAAVTARGVARVRAALPRPTRLVPSGLGWP